MLDYKANTMPAGPNTQWHASKLSYSFNSIASEAKLDGIQITYDVCIPEAIFLA
jgi:hypothetical protein